MWPTWRSTLRSCPPTRLSGPSRAATPTTSRSLCGSRTRRSAGTRTCPRPAPPAARRRRRATPPRPSRRRSTLPRRRAPMRGGWTCWEGTRSPSTAAQASLAAAFPPLRPRARQTPGPASPLRPRRRRRRAAAPTAGKPSPARRRPRRRRLPALSGGRPSSRTTRWRRRWRLASCRRSSRCFSAASASSTATICATCGCCSRPCASRRCCCWSSPSRCSRGRTACSRW
mmetsp:Transcript_13256/g.43839  ORF Transcript_13256/g.43839 Transcript_13256/m.43839 type:complete len:228 (+) Transcript_13256:277-960(+)